VASVAVHRAEALGNRDHADWLVSSRPNDPIALRWAVTATFYSALHAISAHLVARQIYVHRHDDRAFVMNDPAAGIPTDVQDAYDFLYRRSIGARYQTRVFTAREVRYLIDNQLAKVLRVAGL
jgi:hypothetical protein